MQFNLGGMNNRLEHIHIKGYKSIQHLDLKIRDLNILIGANGAGKSNFISVFRLLRQIVGKKLQSNVRIEGGADKLLHFGSKQTEVLEIELDFTPNFYRIALRSTDDDSLFIDEEATGFLGKNYDRPFWSKTSTNTVESKILDDRNNPVTGYVLDTLKSWRVYHFHDTSASSKIKKTGAINDNLYLQGDASNLAAFLYRMQVENLSHFERIESTIRLFVPGFQEFLLRPIPENPETIRLEWYSNQSEYLLSASQLSDGSLRFICLCTLLLQADRPNLILLDEPELGLHPAAIQILGGLIRKASHFSQIIVSTQSSELVSCFEADDIIVVEQHEGTSEFIRQDQELLKNWLEGYQYSMGQLWEKNIIGGRP